MSTKTVKGVILPRHDTALNWSKATSFIPRDGELIIYSKDTQADIDRGYYLVDNKRYDSVTIDNTSYNVMPSDKARFKLGDGVSNVNALPFAVDTDGTVDQTYNPESENAQSGKAIAQAIDDTFNDYIVTKSFVCKGSVNDISQTNKNIEIALSILDELNIFDISKFVSNFYMQFNSIDNSITFLNKETIIDATTIKKALVDFYPYIKNTDKVRITGTYTTDSTTLTPEQSTMRIGLCKDGGLTQLDSKVISLGDFDIELDVGYVGAYLFFRPTTVGNHTPTITNLKVIVRFDEAEDFSNAIVHCSGGNNYEVNLLTDNGSLTKDGNITKKIFYYPNFSFYVARFSSSGEIMFRNVLVTIRYTCNIGDTIKTINSNLEGLNDLVSVIDTKMDKFADTIYLKSDITGSHYMTVLSTDKTLLLDSASDRASARIEISPGYLTMQSDGIVHMSSGSAYPITLKGSSIEITNESQQDILINGVATPVDANDAANKGYVDSVIANLEVGGGYIHPTSHPASMITGLATVATTGNYSDLTGTPTSMTPKAHNQASSTINKMTGYSKPTSTSAISTSDSLNVAIGKLEKALDEKQASGNYSTTGHSHTTSDITNFPTLATVATSGSYTDLSNKPTIPAAYTHPSSHPASMITGLANVATSGSYNDLSNKPTIPAAYTLPAAGSSLGGVKSGGDVTISNGVITVNDNSHNHTAYVNQNAFSNIKIGSTTIAADTTTDTLELAGSNVTITPDTTNDKITISVANGSTSTAGIVKLTDSISSTSTSTAATPNSVKTAYDSAISYIDGKFNYNNELNAGWKSFNIGPLKQAYKKVEYSFVPDGISTPILECFCPESFDLSKSVVNITLEVPSQSGDACIGYRFFKNDEDKVLYTKFYSLHGTTNADQLTIYVHITVTELP